MKKQLTLIAAIAAANVAMADSAFDQFIADSTVDVKARSIYVKMNANDVDYSDRQYDSLTAAGILVVNDPGTAATLVATWDGFGGYGGATPNPANPLDVQAAIDGLGQLAAVTAGINQGLKEEVEKQGSLDQAGSALWLQLESGYLYDIIGFDLGFQASTKHFKNDESDELILKPGDDGYSRLSTARIKAKYGSDDVYVQGHYGYYSNLSETDYLMDDSDLSYNASAHYYDFSLSYSSTLASSDVTESEFTENDPASRTLKLAYASDYGNASIARAFTPDVSHTDTVSAASGLPLALLGLPVADDKMMDYLLMGEVSYSLATDDVANTSTNDYTTTLALQLDKVTTAATYYKHSEEDTGAYELMAALELDELTVAASLNQNSNTGSKTGVANLTDDALINDFDMADQKTFTIAAELKGALIGVPGLSVSAIHMSSSNITLAGESMDYQLTGDAEFSETLVDTKYSFAEDSLLNGLSVRAVIGSETNQANVSGYGLFVDYNLNF